MSYVYLIRHATKPMFKIGKSKNPLLRSSAFKEELDFDNSLRLHLGKRSSNFEKGLHALFDGYRLPPISDGEGATEWFKIECWDRCLTFFEQYRDLIGVRPELIPPLALTSSASLTAKERAERRQKNKELEQLRLYDMNRNSIYLWEQFLSWLAKQKIIETRINEYGLLEIVFPSISKEERSVFVSTNIGRPIFFTKNGGYLCGIEVAHGDSNKSVLSLRRLSAYAVRLVQTKLEPDLRKGFEDIDTWLVDRMNNASQTELRETL